MFLDRVLGSPGVFFFVRVLRAIANVYSRVSSRLLLNYGGYNALLRVYDKDYPLFVTFRLYPKLFFSLLPSLVYLFSNFPRSLYNFFLHVASHGNYEDVNLFGGLTCRLLWSYRTLPS